jgi:hypothetical protein
MATSPYTPALPSVFENFTPVESLSAHDHAFDIYTKLLIAKKTNEALFLVIGKLLSDIRNEELYKSLDYETFTDFLGSEEISYSKEAAYMYMRVYEYYIEYLQMSEESVGNINISRLSMMIPVLKQIEDKTDVVKKIDELSALRHSDFVLKVKQEKKSDKPSVYYSEALSQWIVEYFNDKTNLHDLGTFKEYQER